MDNRLTFPGGNNELEKLRMMSYSNTNVFLLCYSMSDKKSFDYLESLYNEIKAFPVPNMLVGIETDGEQKIAAAKVSIFQFY